MKPEQSHLSEELEQFQREIEYLSKVDFSKGTAARKRGLACPGGKPPGMEFPTSKPAWQWHRPR